MHNYDRVLLSGASGAIGSLILKQLRQSFDGPIFCILRDAGSEVRLIQALGQDINRSIIPLFADLTDPAAVSHLSGSIGRGNRLLAIHCAGDVSWTKSERIVAPINISGTREFAKLAVASSQGQPSIIFLSTAYCSPDEPARNAYERTKLAAENLLISDFGHVANVGILKCSLVTGRQSDGWISRFNGLYPLVRLVALAEVPCLIADPTYVVDTIPTDFIWSEIAAAADALGAGANPIRLVASAGPAAIKLGNLVKLVTERVNRMRAKRKMAELPVLSVLAERQYRFLMRASKSWDLEARFARVEQISEIMSGYIVHGGSGREITPLTLSGPPPDPKTYLSTAIDYWLDQHQQRIFKEIEPEWLSPRGKAQ